MGDILRDKRKPGVKSNFLLPKAAIIISEVVIETIYRDYIPFSGMKMVCLFRCSLFISGQHFACLQGESTTICFQAIIGAILLEDLLVTGLRLHGVETQY